MAKPLNFLALDLGAESGRAILGELDAGLLRLSEIHRFPNQPINLPDGLHWDVMRLWREIQEAITMAVHNQGKNLVGVGLDTWGVDFALLDRKGALIANPHHYRDSRTEGMLDEAFRRVPREAIYQATGIQFMQINTLYQLLSMVIQQSPTLEIAHTFLTIPDLLNYWLTGEKVCEFTIATTTQCYDPRQGDWALSMLEKLNIPTYIFPKIIPPGTVLGKVLGQVTREAGLTDLPVIAPACHDTGSAVAAIPAENDHFAYISSGTWSLMGAEITEPVVTSRSLALNFTNEGGVNGTFRFLKNITGMWLVQECRRTWASQGKEHSYDELTEMAAQAEPFRSLIDPDASDFLYPGDMPARIGDYCKRHGQPIPDSKGAFVRCALESLALKYRWVLDQLEELLGYRLEPIHIVGGGSRNRMLSQFTADATGRVVITGPVEATATGNILEQAIALGYVSSLQEARSIIRKSFKPEVFKPVDMSKWDEAYQQMVLLMAV